MTLSDFATFSTAISGLAVTASLIYLAVQTHQNSKHSRALIQQGRAEQFQDLISQCAADPTLAEVVMRGGAGDLTMDPIQTYRFMFTMIAVFYNWEDGFYQHRDGLIDDERHIGTIALIRQRFQAPGFRAVWKYLRATYGTDFQSFMDGLIDDASVPAQPVSGMATWRALVQDELAPTRA